MAENSKNRGSNSGGRSGNSNLRGNSGNKGTRTNTSSTGKPKKDSRLQDEDESRDISRKGNDTSRTGRSGSSRSSFDMEEE